MTIYVSSSIPTTADASGTIASNVPCESSVYVGAAVYIDATNTAVNAIATSAATSKVIGIVESKAGSTLCTIRVTGFTSALFLGLDATKEYYLSDTDAGDIVTTIPTTSGHVRIKIGQPLNEERFTVQIGERLIRA